MSILFWPSSFIDHTYQAAYTSWHVGMRAVVYKELDPTYVDMSLWPGCGPSWLVYRRCKGRGVIMTAHVSCAMSVIKMSTYFRLVRC